MLFCLVLGSSWYLIFLTSTTLWFYIWAEVPFSLVTLVDCIGESYFFYSDALFFTPSTSWLSDLVDIILGLFFVFIGLTFYRVLLRMQWFGLVYLCGNLFFFFLVLCYCFIFGALLVSFVDLQNLGIFVLDDQAFFEEVMETFRNQNTDFFVSPIVVGFACFGCFFFFPWRLTLWCGAFVLFFFLEDFLVWLTFVVGFGEALGFIWQLKQEYFLGV